MRSLVIVEAKFEGVNTVPATRVFAPLARHQTRVNIPESKVFLRPEQRIIRPSQTCIRHHRLPSYIRRKGNEEVDAHPKFVDSEKLRRTPDGEERRERTPLLKTLSSCFQTYYPTSQLLPNWHSSIVNKP